MIDISQTLEFPLAKLYLLKQGRRLAQTRPSISSTAFTIFLTLIIVFTLFVRSFVPAWTSIISGFLLIIGFI